MCCAISLYRTHVIQEDGKTAFLGEILLAFLAYKLFL